MESALTLSYDGGDTPETLYPFLVKDYLDRDLRAKSERKRNQGDRHHIEQGVGEFGIPTLVNFQALEGDSGGQVDGAKSFKGPSECELIINST